MDGRIEISKDDKYLLIAGKGKFVVLDTHTFEVVKEKEIIGRFAFFYKEDILFQSEAGIYTLYNIKNDTLEDILKIQPIEYVSGLSDCEFMYFNNLLSIFTVEGLYVYDLKSTPKLNGIIKFKFDFPTLYGFDPNGNLLTVFEARMGEGSSIEIFDLQNLSHKRLMHKSDDGWSGFNTSAISTKQDKLIVEEYNISASSEIWVLTLPELQLIKKIDNFHIRESQWWKSLPDDKLLVPISHWHKERYIIAIIDLKKGEIIKYYRHKEFCIFVDMQFDSKQNLFAVDSQYKIYYWKQGKTKCKLEKSIKNYLDPLLGDDIPSEPRPRGSRNFFD